jgi:hypothetical protein
VEKVKYFDKDDLKLVLRNGLFYVVQCGVRLSALYHSLFCV